MISVLLFIAMTFCIMTERCNSAL